MGATENDKVNVARAIPGDGIKFINGRYTNSRQIHIHYLLLVDKLMTRVQVPIPYTYGIPYNFVDRKSYLLESSSCFFHPRSPSSTIDGRVLIF